MADATDKAGGGLPLRVVLFVAAGLIAVLAAGLSIGLTVLQGRQLSATLVNDALERSRTAEQDFRAARFRELELVGQLIGDDPYFSNVVANATGGGLFGEEEVATNSLRDQLDELRERIGFDLGLVLDPDGYLLAHSERPVGQDEWLGEDALVAGLLEELLPVVGYKREGDRLYQVALSPMAKGGALIGFVGAGLLVNDALAEEIGRISGTELILMMDGAPVASTLPERETGEVLATVAAGSSADDRMAVSLDEGRWVAAVDAIDTAGGVKLQSLALMSTDRPLAAYRELLTFLFVGGVIIVLAALGLSLLISRRIAQPLTRLSRAAEAAAGGEFERRFDDVGGFAEVSSLGRAFSSLMSDLRETRDMQEYVADLYRYLPDPGIDETRAVAGNVSTPASRDLLYLLGIEYRRVGNEDLGAGELVTAFEANARALADSARQASGQLELFEGQRAILSFAGRDALARALHVGGTLTAVPEHAPALALAKGGINRATIRVGGTAHRVLVGRAVLQADLLLEESKPTTLLASPALKEELKALIPVTAQALHVERGRLSGRRYLGVGVAALADVPLPGITRDGESTRAGEAARAGPPTGEATIEPGDLFAGRYEVVSVLGRGGMGVVFKAFDRELEDFVALKTLLPHIAADTRYLEQLKEEIKLARKVTHESVLRTHDFGQHGSVPYISMEYVRGMTLRYLLEQRQQLPFSAGLRVARQLAAGLAAAHRQGVVHRDVKPENVILHATGRAKLMDFGIASPMQRMDAGRTGVFVGTPSYAAPEQMEGKPLDSRADIYACGVLMYELFSGKRPFRGDMMAIFQAKIDGAGSDFPAVAMPGAASLAPIIARCLEPNPAARFADGRALLEALEAIRG